MGFSWNHATSRIILGVVLQSFCSFKLVWLNPLLPAISREKFTLSHGTVFMCAWALTTFFSRITGSYVLGKYAEAKGFLATQKIIILGYILTTFLFFLCCSYANFHQIRPIMLVITYFNVFLFPATVILPAMYLMKMYDASSHVKISMLMLLASVLGYVLSSVLSAKYSLQIMSVATCISSILCGFIYYAEKISIPNLEISKRKENVDTLPLLPNYQTKILTLLVGGVCGAGMTHNYFFIEPYLINVMVVNLSTSQLRYISFYIALGVFLVLASKISDYINLLKLMLGL